MKSSDIAPHFGKNVLLYGSHEWLPYSKDEVRLKTVNCTGSVVIPSERSESRDLRISLTCVVILCQDPSTPLRFAQDDRLFFCLRLRLKSSFSQCLLKPITLIGVCRCVSKITCHCEPVRTLAWQSPNFSGRYVGAFPRFSYIFGGST